MRISEIEEGMFGTAPKRTKRNGSRPDRGHKTEPRYQSTVDEVSKPTLSNYVKAAGKDMVDRASSDSFKSGKAGDKYNKADATHKDSRREKGIDRALRKLTSEQAVSEAQFNSKQEVINHFVKQGKSAAAGASAWERGWRGHTPKKKPTQAPSRSYHDDLDDKRYPDDQR